MKWPGKPRTGANPDEEIRPNGDLDTQASRSVRRGWPYLLVFAAVILANSVYLIGYTQFDPLIGRGGVSASITHGLVAGSNTIDPNDGFTAQALGSQALHQLTAGNFPWWNHFEGLGAPLVGEMQSAATFPLLVLQGLPQGFLIYHMVLELLAGWFTVAFCRSLKMGSTPSAVAGVVFGLNGALVWLTNAPSAPVPFVPLLLLGVERAFQGGPRRSLRGVATIGTALWLSLTAGFPEGAYLAGVLAAAYAIWRVIGASGYRIIFLLRLVLGGILGLLLAAPSLLAFLQYLAGGANIGSHAGGFSGLGLPHLAFTQMLAPYALGPINRFSGAEAGGAYLSATWGSVGGYATAAVVFLAIAGTLGARLRGLRFLCAGWIVLSLGRTFALPVVTPLVNLIPGMSLVAAFRYLNPTWVLCLAILAALAVDDARRRELPRRNLLIAAALTAGALVEAWRVSRSVISNIALNAEGITTFTRVSFAWAIVSAATVFVVMLTLRRGHRPRLAQASLVAILSLEAITLFALPSLSAPKSWKPDQALITFLSAKSSDHKLSGLGRIYSINNRPEPNYGSYFQVAQLNTNDQPVPRVWSEYVKKNLDPTGDPLHFRNRNVSGEGLSRRLDLLATHLQGYRNASVSHVITPVGLPVPANLTGVLVKDRDTQTSSIYRLVGSAPYLGVIGGACHVDAQGRDEAVVDCPAKATLVRRELYDVGWTASVNGRPAAIRSDDGTFQYVDLPRGSNRVVFAYSPPGGSLALLASILAGVTLAILFLARVPRARLRRRGRAAR